MVQVRKNVFETNSSSTHSLVMAVQSDFDKWENGELYYCEWFSSKLEEAGFEKKDFYTKEEVKKACEILDIDFNSEDDDGWSERREHFVTYDEFCDTDYLETNEYSYTTPSGEIVKAIAKFGYDG